MGYCTQSTPFQASEKQGTAVGLEIGQPGKFVAMLGVLWFQSPKMARNAFTAAEDTTVGVKLEALAPADISVE
ncbi:unnamed protein product [Sphagnum troendelagicum]